MIRMVWFAVFLVLNLHGQGQVNFATGRFPPVPSDGIYDPEGWLTDDARSEMTLRISNAREHLGSRLFVVILPEVPNLSVDVLAGKLGNEWGDGDFWGILIHVIGDPESPHFFSERPKMLGWDPNQLEEFDQSLEQALRVVESRAKREEDERLKVKRGLLELADEVGYQGIIITRIERNYNRARGEGLQKKKTDKSNRWFLIRAVVAASFLVLLIASILVYRICKKRKERKVDYHFPETSPRKRFGAPWCGGGDVLIQFTNKVGEDGSRRG